MDFVAIDFETATREQYSVCALAFTEVENGEILGTHYTLVQPPNNEYSPFMVDVHNITPAMTADIETFDILWPWIKTVINGKIIVAHKASFDIGVLKQCLDYYGLEGLEIADVLCSVKIAQKCLPNLKNHKLATLAKYFEIDLDHHNARSDAEACAAITLKMVRSLKGEHGGIELNKFEHREDFIAPEVKKSPSRGAFRKNWQMKVGISVPEQAEYDIKGLPKDNRFDGFVFIFTGELKSLTRDNAEKAVKRRGATIPSRSVTMKTTHIVVGEGGEGTVKHRKAVEYRGRGIPITIWNENDLLRALGIEKEFQK